MKIVSLKEDISIWEIFNKHIHSKPPIDHHPLCSSSKAGNYGGYIQTASDL